MLNRTAKFASAIFAGVVAGASITIIPSSAAVAANDCLTEPGKKTPEGQHWHYRLEHGTKRQCWYLRGDGDQSAPAESSAKAATLSRAKETAAARPVADAYDQLPASRLRGEPDSGAAAAARQAPAVVPAAADPDANQNSGTDAGAGATAPVDSVPQSLVASRWPDPSAANGAVNPAPEASATVVADAGPTPQAEPAPEPAPVTVAEAAAPAEQPAGSSRTLLLVILGALALAGLTGSMIYRIGRARDVMRATARRRDIRPSADPARRSPWADIPPEDLADVAHHSDYAPPQSRSYAEDWVAPSLGSSR